VLMGPSSLNTFRPPAPIERPPAPATGKLDQSERSSSPFMDRLADAVADVNGLQQEANLQAENLATGDAESLQDVVVAVEKADLALQLTVQVTQKAVQAYQEVSRLQV